MSTKSLDKLPEAAAISEKYDSHMTCESHSWTLGGWGRHRVVKISWHLISKDTRHEYKKLFTTAFYSGLV